MERTAVHFLNMDGWMDGWKDRHIINRYTYKHIIIYNTYITYTYTHTHNHATDWHISLWFFPHIYMPMKLYTVRARSLSSLSHLALYFKWVKHTTTNKKNSNASLKASDHKLLHIEYTSTQTLLLFVYQKNFMKKIPQIQIPINNSISPSNSFKTSIIYLGCLLWIWMAAFIKQKNFKYCSWPTVHGALL